jgi:zinc protease
MELYLVEDHKLPLIQVNLMVKNGWAADPVDLPGTAAITAELLDEGTKNMSALEISDEIRRLGAVFNTLSDFHNSEITLNTLKKNLDESLNLMAEVVVNPVFPEEELERIRNLYLGRIQQEARRPFTIAYKIFNKELFGDGHPYAQPYTGTGTEASVSAITLNDIKSFYKANYVPNNSAVVVVGDITLDEAKSKIEKAFKNWKQGESAPAPIADINNIDKTKICIVDNPNAAQSVIIIGNPSLKRNDADYTAVRVMNNVLGGQPSARLNMNIREDKGYTYGAFSALRGRKAVGSLFAYAEVQTEVTKESLVEFLYEFNGIIGDRPVTEEDLKDSKANLIKSFPRGFQNFSGIADGVATIVTMGLPIDEWSKFGGRVKSIDLATANKAAKDYVRPDGLLIVIFGDREKIEPAIRDLNLGEIYYLDPGSI